MIRIGPYFLLFVLLYAPTWSEEASAAMNAGKFKEAIEIYEKQMAKGGTFDDAVKLSTAYYRDQNHKLAIEKFLQATENVKVLKGGDKSDARFDEALELYFSGGNPREAALKILERFDADNENGSSPLQFLLATAYANINRFEEFFNHFAKAYPYYSDHWLAYKSRAALHLWLLPRQCGEEKKEFHRKQAQDLVLEAIKRYPADTGLYRWMMTLAPDEEHAEVVSAYLQKIINDNIVVARSEIAFFVQQSVQTGQYDLAQRFLNKAKGWYAFSKAIKAAQSYLDNQKKK